MTLAEAMERARNAFLADLAYLVSEGFTYDEAVAIMRLREIKEVGW